MKANQVLRIAAISGAIAVAFGAFGAHKLKELIDEKSVMNWETGVKYQMLHTLAMLACGILLMLQPVKQLQPLPEEDPLEDYLKTTPTIPDAVYDALPLLLKDGARAFTDKRKRDVFFTGAISIISGCLPNVTGVYFQERVYPHLYTFIIAPAASGKGVLKNAKRLADKYHQKILQQKIGRAHV